MTDEVKLKPGWLLKDIRKAAARAGAWAEKPAIRSGNEGRDMTKPSETFADLRKRLRGCAPGIDMNLDRDICTAIGIHLMMLTTSIDAVDAATRRTLPGWWPISLVAGTKNVRFSLMRTEGQHYEYGVGPIECLARLDALLAAISFEEGQRR